jgi:1,2-diacylglycerol 3-alpha-glucosyltransferase
MMRRMPTHPSLRIAMVAACPFPSPRGSQVLIRELAQALSERGHQVHLVTYPYGENLTAIHGLRVHRVPAPACLVARPPGLGWRRVLLDIYLVAALYRVVRRERIDVIHAHNYEGPLIAFLVRALTGTPVVYHSHNALGDELPYYFRPGWRQSLAARVGRFLDRHVPRRADFSIALSAELESYLRRNGVAAERLTTIPPAVAALAFAEVAPVIADGFADRFVVMYAGNLDPYQDLDVLFDAFSAARPALGDALLVVVTHDARWAERSSGRLAALVRSGHARVIVTPAFATVRRLLASADVLVSPRSSWSGFPIKLINYMAAGRAIVAAAGSAKGVAHGQTGLVFANGDARGLAAALVRLFQDGALRQQLGGQARAVARAAFSWTRAAAEVEDIYGKLCVGGADTLPGSSPVRGTGELTGSPRGRKSAASGNRRE